MLRRPKNDTRAQEEAVTTGGSTGSRMTAA